MLALLAELLPLVGGVAGLISLALHGLKALASKTKTPVDDEIVNALMALDPAMLASVLDKLLKIQEPVKAPAVQTVPTPPVAGKTPAVLMAPDKAVTPGK